MDKILTNFHIGHIVVFIVIGSLLGYGPLSSGIIRRTRRATDTLKRYLTRASVLSLIFAIVIVTIFDRYQHFIPWANIPTGFWYFIGFVFAIASFKKYMAYRKSRDKQILYNSGWYALAGLLIIVYETMDPDGTGGFIVTLVILLLAVSVRFCYWKELHHHAKGQS